MTAIALEAVTRTYPNGHAAVRRLDLEIEDGEFLVLVGPSGCGKSMLLRLSAGLEAPTSGRIVIAGTDVTGLPPQARDLAMVFHSCALYPHMSVRGNLAYGLTVRRTDPAEVVQRVASVAAALGIKELLDRRPAQLSHGRHGVTVVYVTHDQEEAMTIGSRVAVMRDGAIKQAAPPLEVYARPANTFTARFIGTPPMNLVPAALIGIDAPAGTLAGIRPQDVTLDAAGRLPAVVDLVEPRGHDYVVALFTFKM